MVAPNPVDALTWRVADALRTLFFAVPGDFEPGGVVRTLPGDEALRHRLEVLASVTIGLASAPPLLSIAISAALEWYSPHTAHLDNFAETLRGALAEMLSSIDALVGRGDLDPAEPDLPFVRDAVAAVSGPESLGPAVAKAIHLYRRGALAPRVRLYEADRRTPYFVRADAPTVYAAVIRPCGYEEGEWEYDLGSLSPSLATLSARTASDLVPTCGDDVLLGFAEVLLLPVAAEEAGARQTDVCDAAIRAAGGVESYDLHSFSAAGAGICEIVSDHPTEPHPAGPIAREATVRLVLVRPIPL